MRGLLDDSVMIRAFTLFLLCTFAEGCIIARGGRLSSQGPLKLISPQQSLQVEVEWPKLDAVTLDQAGMASIEPEEAASIVLEELASAGLNESGDSRLTLQIRVRTESNMSVALLSGLISGATLGVVPAYARDHYVMTAEVIDDGRLICSYEYRDYLATWGQILLVFAMPFDEFDDDLRELLRDMVRHLVRDMRGRTEPTTNPQCIPFSGYKRRSTFRTIEPGV